jgi:putative phosphoribosyl transferase
VTARKSAVRQDAFKRHQASGARRIGCEVRMIFETRSAAGRALVPALLKFQAKDPVVLAVPRGGVAVAAEIAMALAAPLDLIFVRKIGAPAQRELAMGAIVDGSAPIIVRNEDIIRAHGIGDDVFRACCEAERAEIDRRRAIYLGTCDRASVAGKVAIVVDDGVATGATIRAALRATRLRQPAWLVFAVPVGPKETIAALRQEADEVICAEIHERLGAVGLHYADFHQMNDAEVIALLERVARGSTPASG